MTYTPLFKRGDKVVPLKKSFGTDFESESRWKSARNIGQPFLYVAQYVEPQYSDRDSVRGHYELTHEKGGTNGNHWAVDDMIPYESVFTKEKLLEMLIKGEINDGQYEHYTK